MDYAIAKAVDIENLSARARRQFDIDIEAGEYVFTPKYDGCAVHIEILDGRVEQCISGSGKPVRSLDHVLYALLVACQNGRLVIDAEAFVPDMAFQEISGLFRRHTGDARLGIKVFNGYGVDNLRSDPYGHRMWRLDKQLSSARHVKVLASSQRPGLYQAKLQAQYHQKLGGFDGCVLHHRDAPYFQGRAKYESVKIKPLLSFDLEVTGVNRAVGEKTGRATCALVCRWQNGGVQEVATGMTHAQQESPEQFVGKIIEVRAMGLTSDGKLREPRFCGVREDKIQPDY